MCLAVRCASSAGATGSVYCTVYAGGLQYVGGVEGRGDGECVHGCGQMSGQVLWLVVCCAGMYVGGCDFEGGDLFGKPYACWSG